MIKCKTRDQLLLQGFHSSYNVNFTSELNSYFLQILQSERHLLMKSRISPRHLLFLDAKGVKSAVWWVLLRSAFLHIYTGVTLLHRCYRTTQLNFQVNKAHWGQTSPPSHPSSSWLQERNNPKKINQWQLKCKRNATNGNELAVCKKEDTLPKHWNILLLILASGTSIAQLVLTSHRFYS